MVSQRALKSDFYSRLPTLAVDKEAEKKGITEEERHLYSLSKSAGWRVLKEYIENLKNDLENLNVGAMESGATFEEIGKNTVVVNLAKGVINRILQKVEDTKDAIEQPERTG